MATVGCSDNTPVSAPPPNPGDVASPPAESTIVLRPSPIPFDQIGSLGVAFVDINDDGRDDLTVVDFETGVWIAKATDTGFETPQSLTPNINGLRAAVWIDIEDDGDLDLFITRRSVFGNPLAPILLEAKDGTYTDVASTIGLAVKGYWEGASFGDLDGDGDLDLILAGAMELFQGEVGHRGTENYRFTNDGNGQFSPAPAGNCLGPSDGEGWGTLIADWNRDGVPDYLFGNDYEMTTVCMGNAEGQHEDQSTSIPLGKGLMGVAIGDVNGDGCPDLYGTLIGSDVLLTRESGGGWVDAYRIAVNPVEDPAATASGYGVAFVDLDSDGDQDITWAAAFEPMSLGFLPGRLAVLENLGGDGVHLRDVSWRQDSPFGDMVHGFGLAIGDGDGDGRPDVFVGVGSFQIFESEPRIETVVGVNTPQLLKNYSTSTGANIWLSLEQPAPNIRAVGASIIVEAAGRYALKTINAGSSYLSQHSYRQHFGMGESTQVNVWVVWPDGAIETFRDLAAGSHKLRRTAPPCESGICGDFPTSCRGVVASHYISPTECQAACVPAIACDWTDDPEFESMQECLTTCANGGFPREFVDCLAVSSCDNMEICDELAGNRNDAFTSPDARWGR